MTGEGSSRRSNPRRWSRLRWGLAAGTAALFGLVACSSPDSPSSASGSQTGSALQPATLRLVALASAQPGVDQAIKDWAQVHPDIVVQANYYPAGDPYTTTVS